MEPSRIASYEGKGAVSAKGDRIDTLGLASGSSTKGGTPAIRTMAPLKSTFPISAAFGSGELWDHTSCRYLEGGLSFYSDKITACGIGHHGTGTPELAAYSGGPIPFEEIAEKRAELIRKNQIGCDTPCRGCPNLERKLWPKPTGLIEWIGITHFNGCNNACDYCWLQWADNGRGRPKFPANSYGILAAIEQLVDRGLITARTIIDFGGGGEPSIAPDFDQLFEQFVRRGLEVWLHTNSVRISPVVSAGQLELRSVHVVCSVDSGTRETYQNVKQRDHFEQVWANLRAYKAAGAQVLVKYIMQSNNCSPQDIEAFMARIRESGILSVLWDIDQRYRNPASEVIMGLAHLHHLCRNERISLLPANIGLNPEDGEEINARIQVACRFFEHSTFERIHHQAATPRQNETNKLRELEREVAALREMLAAHARAQEARVSG